MLVLGDLPGPDAAPKSAVLSRLRHAGLPVPPGLALLPGELARPEIRAHLESLLQAGPVIVRAALAREDTADAAAAGLGLSVPSCRDLADIDRAAADIADAARDPWLLRYSGGGEPAYQLLVQHQVERRWLLVVAADRDGARLLERHDAERADALAAGASPTWSGPLALAEPALAATVTSIFDHVERVLSQVPTLDLELVVDPAGAAWLVQARPLARPLTSGWPEFCAAVAPGRDRVPDLPGLWRLDAEHNPAALSPAHAGVITWLIGQGARLRVLGGWLYEPVGGSGSRPALDPRQALVDLRERHLPAARRLLAAVVGDLGGDLRPVLARALEHLRSTLDVYAAIRVELPRDLPEPDSAAPLSLRDRGDYLDVLPLAWDIASPALADLVDPTCLERNTENSLGDPLDPVRAAVLVRELDDHLFALGLAPLRRVYLAAGRRLGLGDDVFLLGPDELRDAFAGRATPDLAQRRREQARLASLRPPLALYDGRPVPLSPRRRLFGIPVGPPARGPVAQRRDLADLLARPPAAGAVVVLPALTAQAAVALQALAVRAVCCEYGGALSHAALMARELGLSALIGCSGCSQLPDGLEVELDTRVGRLRPRDMS